MAIAHVLDGDRHGEPWFERVGRHFTGIELVHGDPREGFAAHHELGAAEPRDPVLPPGDDAVASPGSMAPP